jgi:hypothetical protein
MSLAHKLHLFAPISWIFQCDVNDFEVLLSSVKHEKINHRE